MADSSLFGMMRSTSSAVGSSVGTAIGPPSRTWILYIGLLIVVVLVVLMLLGIPLSLSWLDPRPKRMKIYQTGHLFWPPSKTYTNLLVPLNQDVPDFHDDSFSCLIDVTLLDTRNYKTTEGPYRQILHRGSSDLAKAEDGGGIIPKGFLASVVNQPLPPFGLPKRMNPGVFLDPNTNDLLVFVDSSLGSETFRESVRIADIPLDTPFRIGVVVNHRVLEVYINCRLEVTKVLSGIPKRVEHEWYGIAGSAAAQAQIQNLYVWNQPLTAVDMRSLCPSLPAFTTKRPVCESTDTSTQDMISATVTSAVSNLVPTSLTNAFS